MRECECTANARMYRYGKRLILYQRSFAQSSTAAKLRIIGVVGQVSVASASINTTDFFKNLDVFLDSGLTFNKYIGKVCQSSYFHIMALRRIRGSLSPEVANTVAYAIMRVRLDYCNSILNGTSKYIISRMYVCMYVFKIYIAPYVA